MITRCFFNFFLNFHSLRISIIYVSVLAFCQVLFNEYDNNDDDATGAAAREMSVVVGLR